MYSKMNHITKNVLWIFYYHTLSSENRNQKNNEKWRGIVGKE